MAPAFDVQKAAQRAREGSRRQRDIDALKSLGEDPPEVVAPNDEAIKRSQMRFSDQLAWAAENLPDEHGPFVASAMGTLLMFRQSVTKESVLARLRDQGRLMSQMEQMNVNERETA